MLKEEKKFNYLNDIYNNVGDKLKSQYVFDIIMDKIDGTIKWVKDPSCVMGRFDVLANEDDRLSIAVTNTYFGEKGPTLELNNRNCTIYDIALDKDNNLCFLQSRIFVKAGEKSLRPVVDFFDYHYEKYYNSTFDYQQSNDAVAYSVGCPFEWETREIPLVNYGNVNKSTYESFDKELINELRYLQPEIINNTFDLNKSRFLGTMVAVSTERKEEYSYEIFRKEDVRFDENKSSISIRCDYLDISPYDKIGSSDFNRMRNEYLDRGHYRSKEQIFDELNKIHQKSGKSK